MTIEHLSARPRKGLRFWCLTTIVIAALAALLYSVLVLTRPTALSASTPEPTDGPPWRHGPSTARFTVVVYADLECPFCQTYTPILRAWVDAHPDVNLQWNHLPLAIHEPAAGDEARWVECFGERFGHARFWEAVQWVYQHTRGGGQGLPAGVSYPDESSVRECLKSDRPSAAVRLQAEQARHDGFDATPSLRLIDNQSNRSMNLTGPASGDMLLSALDLLSLPESDKEDGASPSISQ
ncbi:thioredoxin domain-containing protein [Xanthomonas arboricola]|uniref:DsbA family protein n=1 Tax=Xanthomonas arboricola TaxID=56448 RepID=UPI002B2CE4C8|nr:thioredoxin domain-containing protein [Xanthomonas arboricola]